MNMSVRVQLCGMIWQLGFFQVHLNLNRKLIMTTERDSNAKYNLGVIS